MEAIIGRGLDSIVFGWSPARLQDELGSADKEYESDDGDHRACYYKMRCTFWFRGDRLHWISCRNPGLLLFGWRLHDQSSQVVLPFLQERLGEASEVDDYGDWESHAFPNSCLELQFECDGLSAVCFGHLFSEDDEPIWPSA